MYITKIPKNLKNATKNCTLVIYCVTDQKGEEEEEEEYIKCVYHYAGNIETQLQEMNLNEMSYSREIF